MPYMSDDEFFGTPAPSPAQQASPAVTPSTSNGLSDDEFFNTKGVSTAAQNPSQSESDSQFWHKISADEPGYTYGDILPTRTANDAKVTPSFFGSNRGVIPSGTKESELAVPEVLRSVGRGIGDLFEQAETQSTNTTPDAINAMAAISSFPSLARGAAGIIGDVGERAAASLSRPAADEMLQPLSKNESAYWDQDTRNHNYVRGLNFVKDSMDDAIDNGYSKAGEMSSGITVNDKPLKKGFENLYSTINDDPILSTDKRVSQVLKDIDAIKNSFDADGNIPLDKITFAQRRVNDLYDPNASEAQLKAYNTANTLLKKATEKAKIDNPEWGAAKTSTDNLFKNKIATYEDDNAGKKIWNSDDQKDYERWQENPDTTGAPVTGDTQEKINNVTNIKSVAQYNRVLRRLPESLHEDFTNDVVNSNLMDNPRLANLIKGSYYASKGRFISAANNFGKVFSKNPSEFNPNFAEDLPHIEDALGYHSDIIDSAHQQYLDKLQESYGAPPSSDSTPALNAPETPILTNTAGVSRHATPQERDASILARQNEQETGMSPGLRAAQAQRIASDKADRLARAQKFHEKYLGRGSSELGRETTGKTVQSYPEDVPPFIRDQFARGGAIKKEVNTDPTPGQKMAGNYKKAHVKFHGLDISIENPKGSERRGVGKDGKEWKASMPDHYGYIKRTQGADGDHIDVYLGENEKSDRVYVIDQKDAETGKFDEHKVMLGYPDRDAATRAYRDAFSDKKNRIMKVTRMTVSEFKDWLKKGNTKVPTQKTA